MFWRKQTKKKCHPCIKLALISATAIGAVAVINKGKCMLKEKMNNMIKFIKNGCTSCKEKGK